MGDADAVKSTALGVKNLQRVTKMLMSATAYKEGETYDQLAELYGRVLSQWSTEMNHVAGIVGGFNSQEKVVGQEGRVFNLIPKEKQKEAVKFLTDNAFTTPAWMIDEEILRRIEPVGAIDRIHTAQNRVLTQLLNIRALRAAAGTGNAGRQPGVLAGGVPGQRAQGDLEGTGCPGGEGGPLPARIAALLFEGGGYEDQPGGARGDAYPSAVAGRFHDTARDYERGREADVPSGTTGAVGVDQRGYVEDGGS